MKYILLPPPFLLYTSLLLKKLIWAYIVIIYYFNFHSVLSHYWDLNSPNHRTLVHTSEYYSFFFIYSMIEVIKIYPLYRYSPWHHKINQLYPMIFGFTDQNRDESFYPYLYRYYYFRRRYMDFYFSDRWNTIFREIYNPRSCKT
jgi:hypothetical protein